MLNCLNNNLNALKKWQIATLGVALLLIVGCIDYVSGFEISISFFYIGPITLVTWYAGKNHGVALSVIAGFLLILAARATNQDYSHPAILYWNTLLEMASYLFVVTLISKVHNILILENQFARIDSLTNIPNRRTFLEQLDSCLHQSGRSKQPFSLAYIDVDNFKHINDKYGHGSGDNVLRLLADALRTHLRRTDIAARLGGDEFALLLPNTNSEGAQNLISKVQSTIRDIFYAQPFSVTVSIGTVSFENLPASSEDAIKITDHIMYQVKQDGKDSIKFDIFR